MINFNQVDQSNKAGVEINVNAGKFTKMKIKYIKQSLIEGGGGVISRVVTPLQYLLIQALDE